VISQKKKLCWVGAVLPRHDPHRRRLQEKLAESSKGREQEGI
jgi:hypothetical protein